MTIGKTPPQGSIRCTTLYGWTIPIFLVFSLFNYREPIPLNPSVLFIFCVFGPALAVPEMLQVLKLRCKKESKITTTLAGLTGAIGILVVLELKRRGIFVWNELYFTAPVTLFALLCYTACFFAENRHSVRVYHALDGYHYVQA